MGALELTHSLPESNMESLPAPKNPDSDLISAWNGALRNLRDELLIKLATEVGFELPEREASNFWIAVHRLRYENKLLDDATRDASQFWLLSHADIQLPPIGMRGACSTEYWVR